MQGGGSSVAIDLPGWVAGLAGTALGFSLAWFRDAGRSRPRLDVGLAGGMALYAERPDGLNFGFAVEDPGRDWFTCEPDEPRASLFVRVDLRLVNRSYLDDAITEAFLMLADGPSAAQPALAKEFAYFYGENIPAHTLRHLRLKFTFDRERYGRFSTWADPGELTLRLLSVRGKTYRLAVPVSDLLVRSKFEPQTRVTNWVLDE